MPRDITVTFGDGSTHVYRGAPDDATPEAVAARAQKDFGKQVTALDGGRKENAPAPTPALPTASLVDRAGAMFRDVAGGAVRGAASIGSTLYELGRTGSPELGGQDWRTLLAGAPTMSSLITGQRPKGRIAERTSAVDAALSSMGADTDSTAYGVGKIGAEVAGTLGVGGGLANILSRIPGAATAAPNLLQAIRSSGMTAGAGGLGTRVAGGAVTGGVSVGLTNPEEAGLGALIGGAIPGAARAAGAAGQAVGKVFRGPEQAPEMAAALAKGRGMGYVVPPTQARASLPNRLMEGIAGKISTAQNASAANQAVTNKAAAKALGLADETPLTPDTIDAVKKAAGVLYDAASSAGTVTPGPAYAHALDEIVAPHVRAAKGFPGAKESPVIEMVDALRSKSFDAAAAVAKIKELRAAADDAFKPGGKGSDIGRAAKAAAKALEDALGAHLDQIGEPALLQQFRDARQLYAKASDVGRALNQASGNVDARHLAKLLQAGKPLTGELRDVAQFAAQFPKATQMPERMGSLPQFSPLDVLAGGGLGVATGNPLSMLAVGARPAARAAALSPFVQNRLVQGASVSAPPGSLEALLLGARAAPVVAADR